MLLHERKYHVPILFYFQKGGRKLAFQVEGMIIIILLISMWLFVKQKRLSKRKFQITREMFSILFLAYVLLVVYMTLEPFQFQIPMSVRPFEFDTRLFYELIHMADGYEHLQILYSVGNIIMFMPLGFLLPILYPIFRKCYLLIITGFFISLLIECTQALFTLTRRGTVNDLFFNTIGAILGYTIFICLYKMMKKISKKNH